MGLNLKKKAGIESNSRVEIALVNGNLGLVFDGWERRN